MSQAVLTTEEVLQHQGQQQDQAPPWTLSLQHSLLLQLAPAQDQPMEMETARAQQAMDQLHRWEEVQPGEGETGLTSSSRGRGLPICRASAAMVELT